MDSSERLDMFEELLVEMGKTLTNHKNAINNLNVLLKNHSDILVEKTFDLKVLELAVKEMHHELYGSEENTPASMETLKRVPSKNNRRGGI